MKKYYLPCCLVMSFLLGCSDSSSPTAVQLNSTINGKNITIIQNQKFLLELDLNSDAGYQWSYTVSDTMVLHIDSTRYRPKSGNWNQDGGITTETFYFSSRIKGRSEISLIEHRVWEKDVPPINSVKFSVTVK